MAMITEEGQTSIPMPPDELPETAPEGPNDDQPPPKRKCIDALVEFPRNACCCLLATIVIIVAFIIFLIYALVSYLICNKDVTEVNLDYPEKKNPIYKQMIHFRGTAFHMARAVSIIHTRIMICLLTWLIINLSVKRLRRKMVLGSYLWQWTLLIVLVSCGLPVIDMISGSIAHYLAKGLKAREDAVYYMRGLRKSFDMIIFSTTLLLAWDLYFSSSQGLRQTPHNRGVFGFVSWTLVTFLLFTLVWLLKNIVLLRWTAQAVYIRFRNRILRAGFQLYFLALISGTSVQILKPKNKQRDTKKKNGDGNGNGEGNTSIGSPHPQKLERSFTSSNVLEKEKRDRDALAEDSLQKLKDRMLSKDKTTYEIEEMARCFINLARISSNMDDGISDILEECREKFPGAKYIKQEHLEELMTEADARDLYEELLREHPSAQATLKDNRIRNISYVAFENWMMRAHKTCSSLGFTLIDAEAAVHCLNTIMICFLVGLFLLIWLLVTGVANVKVLVLIGSQLVALSFIFGQSCKTLFEGILFAFVRHPFDVGDRCLITDKDTQEMEVKRLGILSTIFLKIGSKEEAIYPNSILAGTPIVCIKGDPQLHDFVEFTLDSIPQTEQLHALREKVEKYLSDEDWSKYSTYHIEVKGGKMIIRFKHVMNVLDMTHSQCHDEKLKRRDEFSTKMTEFLGQLNIKYSLVSHQVTVQ